MPAQFLTPEQRRHYGRFVGDPTPEQFGRYFHLDDHDRVLIATRDEPHTQLGMAVQVGTVRFLGLFPTHWETVPTSVVQYVAVQLGITGTEWETFLKRETATREQYPLIEQAYGYQSFQDPAMQLMIRRWLYARAWLNDEPPGQLFDLAVEHLKHQKVLLPGLTTLERLIRRVRDRVQKRIWKRLYNLLTPEQRTRLLELVPQGTEEMAPLVRLRRGPVVVSPPALKESLDRLKELRQIGVGHLDVSWLAPDRLKKLARYAALSRTQAVRRLREPRRSATLAAFVYVYETVAIDDTLDLFDALVQSRLTRTGNLGEQKRLRTLRDLDVAALTLHQGFARLMKIDENQLIRLGEVLFSYIPKEALSFAMTQVSTLTRPPDDTYYELLRNHYSQFRRFLPTFWHTLTFEGADSEKPLLEAITFLKKLDNSPTPDLSVEERQKEIDKAPLDVVTRQWKSLVVEASGHTNLTYYTFCALLQLRDALRRRTIFVSRSERWGDLRAKLLSDEAWEKMRKRVCRSLGHETVAKEALQQLEKQMDETYQRVEKNLEKNTVAQLEVVNGKTRFAVDPLDAVAEPPSLVALKAAMDALLPRLDMPELVMEMATLTGCLTAFTHINEEQARVADLHLSLCAMLLAEAFNVSLTPFVRPSIPAFTRGRLTWVQQNYLRTETIVKANTYLVKAQDSIPLARAWGGGEVAVSDGLRFVVPVRSAFAAANSRYFGEEKGITWYHWMSNQYGDLHGIAIPGATKDGPYLLEGLIEQETHLRPKELMTDTGGYSDIVFGLFWLLGYQFSPRLADLGDARFWRMNRETDYGALNELARQTVNVDFIAEHWDDFLRAAGSLKMGNVKASELVKALHRSGYASTLARGLAELGRIPKTLFLLNYVDDATYRRRILIQLNRIEGRHSLARTIYFGRQGKLYQHYRQGMEDQLNALGLVLNMVVLWNTRYMDAALNHLRAEGFEVRPEDVERLSPLRYEHINFLGRYLFTLPEEVEKGQLRPFHNPRDPANLL